MRSHRSFVSGATTRLWLLFLALWPHCSLGKKPQDHCVALERGKPDLYSFEVVAEYPHDPKAFTQGLVFDRRCDGAGGECTDILWESTGNYGESEVRAVDLATGRVEDSTALEHQYFGEGLAKRGDRLYQITWERPDGFIYSTDGLKQVGTFKTPLRDGWGVAADGDLLVVSDGSSKLTWVNPDDGFKRVRQVTVKAEGREVRLLNELEMVGGEVWANVWMTECIARICPATGAVKGWVLMHGLAHALQQRGLPMEGKAMDVLNGIAWDPLRRRLFVTGKWWPRLFEVAVKAVNPHAKENKRLASRCII